jgi:hypothetical protein
MKPRNQTKANGPPKKTDAHLNPYIDALDAKTFGELAQGDLFINHSATAIYKKSRGWGNGYGSAKLLGTSTAHYGFQKTAGVLTAKRPLDLLLNVTDHDYDLQTQMRTNKVKRILRTLTEL